MRVDVSPFKGLEDARDYAIAAIDSAAEQARLKYITPGSGQAMEYQQAIQEAKEFLSDSSGSFPMLEATVSAGVADDKTQAANQILENESFAKSTGAVIRRIRLAAKHKIRGLEDMRSIALERDSAVCKLESVG
jgi:hypothetical protein